MCTQKTSELHEDKNSFWKYVETSRNIISAQILDFQISGIAGFESSNSELEFLVVSPSTKPEETGPEQLPVFHIAQIMIRPGTNRWSCPSWSEVIVLDSVFPDISNFCNLKNLAQTNRARQIVHLWDPIQYTLYISVSCTVRYPLYISVSYTVRYALYISVSCTVRYALFVQCTEPIPSIKMASQAGYQ